VQLFAPDTTTGNLTLVDLGAKGERSPVAFHPPNRGSVMWTFVVSDVEEAARRVATTAGEIIAGPRWLDSPVWGPHQTLIVATPGGFRLELIQPGVQ
jgi:predicted enzyme related to lactoylglutathione lyase